MSPLSWLLTLPVSFPKGKPEFGPDICCPVCSERIRISRFGHYCRNCYEGQDRIAVQRYACGNGDCIRRTFSVLPHPYLPKIRLPIGVLFELYRRHFSKGEPIGRLARAWDHSWNTIRRAVDLAHWLVLWLRREIRCGALAPQPLRPALWPVFCRHFSYALMPEQFIPKATNTTR